MRTLLIIICCLVSVPLHAQSLPELIPYKWGALYGYCDSNGRVMIKPQWVEAHFFVKNKARVVLAQNGKRISALIDKKGNYLIEPENNWTGGEFNIISGLNTRDSSGKMGYIDRNGRYIIPPLYQHTEQFKYNAYLRGYYLPACKNGMWGLLDTNGNAQLPFLYNSLDFPKPEATVESQYTNAYMQPSVALQQYVIAINDCQYALLTMTGNIAIPFGTYQYISFVPPNWIAVEKDKRYALLDTNLKAVTPFKYSSVPRYLNDTMLRVTVLKNGVEYRGIINQSMQEILPARYTELEISNRYYIALTKDSGTKKRIEKEYYSYGKMGRLYRHIYKQTWDIRQPRHSSWMEVLKYKHFIGYPCGGSQGKSMDEIIASYPRININGKRDYTFSRRDTTWNTIRTLDVNKIVVHPDQYPISEKIYGIVDEEGDFLKGPITNMEPMEYHQPIGMYTVRIWDNYDRTKYALVDTNFKVVIPPQGYYIYRGFSWKHNIYALGTKDYREDDERYTYDNLYEYRNMQLLDSTGDVITALTRYRLQMPASSKGIPTISRIKPFEGVFLAADSANKQGYVTIDGKILFPEISFKYEKLEGFGDHYFLAGKKHDRYSILINEHNKEYSPGIQVRYMQKLDNTSLYLLKLMNDDSPVYLNSKGRLYMGAL